MIGLRQLSLLLLSVVMIVAGIAGLAGRLPAGPGLVAILLAVAFLILIDLGRQSRGHW